MPMAHLHLHSSYSELDAIAKIPDIVKRATELDWGSMCLTDHGTIAGVPEFHAECKKQGIKPILGCEFYFTPNFQESKSNKNRKKGHLILMAIDHEGWVNMKKLITRSADQFYYSPTIDYNDLRKHSNGLICLSACLKNPIAANIIEEKYDEAAKHVLTYKDIFGDRFYLEVQDGGLDVQLDVNKVIRRMGQKFDVPIVATQDAHYLEPQHAESHEAIWAIRTRDTLDRPCEGDIKKKNGRCEGDNCNNTGHDHNHNMNDCRVYYSTKEFWLKDGHHILNEDLTTEYGEKRRSDVIQEEIEMSAKIADRITEFEIKDGLHLPKYEFIPEPIIISNSSPQMEYLRTLVKVGYEQRYKNKWDDRPDEHRARLKKEMNDIEDAHLADYFLIVWDFVNWAREQNIKVGPGRGSAAGSMVSYSLGITNIEPLRYGLIWERFYNVGRKGSLADIDMDFPKSRRDEVIKYLAHRYGEDRVAQMVTFNTMAAKAALKDTAKLLGKHGMAFEDANVMTRFVDKKPGATIKQSLDKSERLQEYQNNNPMLFRIAQMLEGCPKSRGTHAAGVIISDESFDKGGVPLRWMTKDKKKVTEFDGETLEKLGYLKVDILGLKTLDVLADIEEEINGKG